jgi:hypothetical protein
MKKKYITPALEAVVTEQALPIAASLQINNVAQDNIEGDVKDAGEWNDIWD